MIYTDNIPYYNNLPLKYRTNSKYKFTIDTDKIKVLKGTGRKVVQCYNGLFSLSNRGTFILAKGFQWDGPSGPAFDTATAMRGSLDHDVLCIACRMGYIDSSCWFGITEHMINVCKQSGMKRLRRFWMRTALNKTKDKYMVPGAHLRIAP